MSTGSTGLSDYEKKPIRPNKRKGNYLSVDEIGAFELPELARLMRVSLSTLYQEARDGRLIISKTGDRSTVTRRHARQYQQLIESEAEARVAAGTGLRKRGDDTGKPDRAERRKKAKLAGARKTRAKAKTTGEAATP